MKKLLVLVLSLSMALAIAACGEKKTNNDPKNETKTESKANSNLIGSWTGVYGEDSSMIMDEPNALTLTFTEDGKGTLKYFSSETEFEWKVTDDKVVCTYLNEDFVKTYNLETYEATIDGDTLKGGHLYGFDFIVAKDGTAAADPSLYGKTE